MSTATHEPTLPAASRGTAEPRWFIDNLVAVHLTGDETAGRLGVVEGLGAPGDMPPLHVHHVEDEIFYVLEGALELHVAGRPTVRLEAGECVLAPRDVPHVYRVVSEAPARWLVLSVPANFERFVLAASDPADAAILPPPDREPDMARVMRAAAEAGIEILGPPGTLPAA
jgi:quercetin dioxygenase-like cupin family protein